MATINEKISNALFGAETPEKKELVYRVETLNKEKGIVTTLRNKHSITQQSTSQ